MRALFKLEFNFDLKQPVNQWISIVFLGCLTMLVLLYYFTAKANLAGENISRGTRSAIEALKSIE
jgi:hypothetical protein